MRPSKRIRRESPFASLLELERLGPRPVDRIREDEAPILLKTIELPADHPAATYIGYRQNDAFVIDFEAQPERAVVTLQHYDIWRLAWCFSAEFRKLPRTTFPVRLTFQRPREVRIVRTVEHGVAQFVRHSWRRPDRFLDLHHFEVAHHGPNVIQCILSVYGSGRFTRASQNVQPYCEDYRLCIHAESLAVEHSLRAEWQGRFGDPALSVFDKFMASNRHFAALRDFERFLAEIDVQSTE